MGGFREAETDAALKGQVDRIFQRAFVSHGYKQGLDVCTRAQDGPDDFSFVL